MAEQTTRTTRRDEIQFAKLQFLRFRSRGVLVNYLVSILSLLYEHILWNEWKREKGGKKMKPSRRHYVVNLLSCRLILRFEKRKKRFNNLTIKKKPHCYGFRLKGSFSLEYFRSVSRTPVFLKGRSEEPARRRVINVIQQCTAFLRRW